MGLLLLLSLLIQAQPTVKPQKEKCSLSGTVLDSITGEPLSKVALRLEPIGQENAMAASTASDAKGNFSLAGLDSGAYHLRGNRSGYVEMLYSVRNLSDEGTTIRLDAGEALNDLKFKLTPAGAIAGTIRDSDGEPLEFARVDLGQITYNDRGKPSLERAGSAFSDDRGEYRFHGLSPGKYYISAVDTRGSGWGDVDRSASKGPSEVAVATFYPGVADSSTASLVEVLAGKRVAGIDVTLLKLHVVCVSGRVGGQHGGRVIVELEAANAALGKYRATTSPKTSAGDFQFCRVPSGAYFLSAYADRLSARIPINVRSVDLTDIRPPLGPGAEIQGHMVAEGPEKPSLADFCVDFSLAAKKVVSSCGDGFKDGAFTISDLRPDHYEVGTSATPRGFYVKSIQAGEVDVFADGLAISGPGVVPLQVVLSDEGSGLSGVVLNKDEKPVIDATVLLMPDQRSRLELFAHATTDQRGHYEFSSLAPGKYKLLAWDDVKPNAWNDPDFLKDYEKQAEKTTLEPKANTTVSLHIAVPPDAR